MPGTPADHRTSPNSGQGAGSLNFLYQRHRGRLQGLDNPQLRPVPATAGNHGLGRQDPYGGEKHRIYPTQIIRSSPNYRSGATNAITSPLLSAIGSTSSTAAQYTSDWARNLPFTNHNQPQLGSSPPPISLIPAGRDISGQSISSSPPPNMRPQSHPNQYANFGGRQRQGSQNSPRRASLYSQYGSPYGHIPLPHEDQPHFHPGGLPDLDSIIPQPVINQLPGLQPGDKGYFCGFDTLSNAGHGPSASAELVLLCGFEGGLVTYKISTKMIQRIGTLEGVGGGVIGAKILPWTLRFDPGSSGRPYVALIVHGPVLEDADGGSSGGSDAHSSDSNPSNRAQGIFLPDVVKYYRTTVEIYSLSTRKHIATIFESPLIPVEYSQIGELRIPKPFGDLRLDAKGKFLVVTSGESGEVFVYSPYTHDPEINNFSSIRCIGKLWTSIQRRETKVMGTPPSPNGIPGQGAEETEVVRPVPIFSLSERWIAIVPPSGPDATSRFSIKGKALLVSSNGIEARPPGINSQAPPPTRPETTCAIDVPEGGMGDTLMDRVSREVTQRVMRGAQWVGEKSRQYWSSYWNPQDLGQYHPPQNMPPHHDSAFPPTHGHNALPPSSSQAPPTQVSVFDLERFLECEASGYSKRATKAALTPLATFELSSGCSHLSFSPHGCHLLTASRKGDEYVVWNVLRMVNPPSPTSSNNPIASTEPYVRQSLRLTRMTTASVSDVVWDALPPFHKKFAIVTGAGTIHAHLVPDGAFTWPPPRNSGRRSRRLGNAARYDQQRRESESELQRPATAVLGTAVGMASSTANWLRGVGAPGAVSPGSVAATGRPKSLSASTASTAASAMGTSTRAVRAGLTAGANMVTNGANTMYRAGENKLHVAGLTTADLGTGTSVMFFRGSKKDHARLLSGSKGTGNAGKGDAARRQSISIGSGSSANGNNALYGFDEEDDDDDGQDSGGKRACFLAVVAGGTVKVYPVRETTIPRKGMPAIPLAAIGRRAVEFVLYKIPDDVFAPAFRRKVEKRFGLDKEPGKDDDAEAEQEDETVGGEWLPRAPAAAQNLLQVPNSHSRSQSSSHSRAPSASGIAKSNPSPQPQQQQKLKPPKGKKGKASPTPSPPAPTSVPAPIPIIETPPSLTNAPIRLRMENHNHGNGNNWHATVEAETNPPYRPFHTDGCVIQFNETPAPVEELEASRETARAASPIPPPKKKSKGKRRSKVVEDEQEEVGDYDSHSHHFDDLSSSAIHDTQLAPKDQKTEDIKEDDMDDKWVFGMPLAKGTPLFAPPSGAGATIIGAAGLESSNVIPVFGEDPYQIDVDGVESDIRVVEGPAGEQVVVTTVRRTSGLGKEDEFFEEGCEIVDWADDRV